MQFLGTTRVLGTTRDHRLTVARISGDRRPGDYTLVNLETRKVELLAQTRPELTREMLAPVSPVEVQVRDGTIYGHVTSPERSPVNLAQRIKAQVLLMQGGDRRAPAEHARRMRAALEEAGNPAEWLYDVRQGHGAAGNEPRREMCQRVLDCLAKNTAKRVDTT